MSEPPVAANVDLRDFAFMPLEVVRLRDSDLAAIASGDAFRAAVMLWCAAWHQIPAASLPTDDRMLARLAGYGRDIQGWLAVKDDALRGFSEYDDGRLYHSVIAEKANEAWKAKLTQRRRGKAGAAARWGSKSVDAEAYEEELPEAPTESNASSIPQALQQECQGTGTGTGTGTDKSSSLRSSEAARARSESLDFRKGIATIYTGLGFNPPDTNRVGVWLAKGHRPELCLAVIGDILARSGEKKNLVYFDKPIAEAHALPAVAGAPLSTGPPNHRQARSSELLEMAKRARNAPQ